MTRNSAPWTSLILDLHRTCWGWVENWLCTGMIDVIKCRWPTQIWWSYINSHHWQKPGLPKRDISFEPCLRKRSFSYRSTVTGIDQKFLTLRTSAVVVDYASTSLGSLSPWPSSTAMVDMHSISLGSLYAMGDGKHSTDLFQTSGMHTGPRYNRESTHEIHSILTNLIYSEISSSQARQLCCLENGWVAFDTPSMHLIL